MKQRRKILIWSRAPIITIAIMSLACLVPMANPGPLFGQSLSTVRSVSHFEGTPSIATPHQIPAMSRQQQKSPAKAFALSLLIPGAGQLYSGRKTGLVFSAVDLGALATSIVYKQKGNDRKAASLVFADAHWDSLRCAPDCLDPNIGTEQLGEPGSQQYYEQIGKYNKFQEGWDDFTAGASGLSVNRETYVSMQHNMNRAYKHSDWALGIILLNHFVSAIHAAILVRADNRSAEEQPSESSLRLHIDRYGQFTPQATVSLSF